MRSKQAESAHVVVREEARTNTFQIDDADHAVTRDQRDGYFGLDIGMSRNIAGVMLHIGYANDLARIDSSADDALAETDVIGSGLGVVTLAEPAAQQAMVFVDQKDTERVEVNQSADSNCDLGQQLIDVKDGAELLRQMSQNAQSGDSAARHAGTGGRYR